jgi:cytochrome c biogenesis protein CcmG/thiol:disulfide interchange protein DsbE
MVAWLRDLVNLFIVWSTPICVGLMAAGLTWLWYLRREQRSRLPRTRRQKWLAFGLQLLSLNAVIVLVVLNWPMTPLTRTMKTFGHAVGEPVPDLSFNVVSDASVHRLGEMKGKVVVLNLWATYCPPCVEEMPMLSRFHSDYEGRGVVVVTLSDESRELLLQFFAAHPTKTVNGYRGSLEWVQLESFRPFTLVVDRSGVLREYVFGPLDYEYLEKKVGPYL